MSGFFTPASVRVGAALGVMAAAGLGHGCAGYRTSHDAERAAARSLVPLGALDGACGASGPRRGVRPASYAARHWSQEFSYTVDLDCIYRFYDATSLHGFARQGDPVAEYGRIVLAMAVPDCASTLRARLVQLSESSIDAGAFRPSSPRASRFPDPLFLAAKLAERCGELGEAVRLYSSAYEGGLPGAEHDHQDALQKLLDSLPVR